MKSLSFIVFAIQSVSAIHINIDLVKDYMKFNNIPISSFLICGNATERVNDIIDLQNDDIWINFWDISSETKLQSLNYKKFVVRLSSPLSVVINLECNKSITFMEEISKRKMFHYERFWLIFGKSWHQAYEILKHQFINMDAEIYLALPTNETCYQIFEVFNPSFLRGGQLNITQIAYWNLGAGFTIVTRQTKIQRRHDLKGLWFLTATAIPTIPKKETFIGHMESNENTHVNIGDRNNYRLFQLIQDMFNFKVVVHRASVWGTKLPNGTWKGVIGMLFRDEVDFGIPAFMWMNERYGAFEYTTHSYHIYYVFVFLHPKSVDTIGVYLSPFDYQVWCLITLIIIVIGYALRQTFLAEYQKFAYDPIRIVETDYTYSKSILIVFGFVVQQSYSGCAVLLSSRILFTAVLIFSVIIFQYYSSFIVASLLTEAPKTINTVKQLLHSGLDCSIDEIAYVRDHIEHYKEESVTKLYDKIIEHPKPFLPLNEGIDLVKKGGHAFDLLTDQETCALHEIKYSQKVLGGPGVPNKSPFRELIKISLRRITETGLLSYNWKIWMGHKPKCAHDKVDVVPVDIIHFSSALYVSVLGIQISVGILIAEIIMNRYRKRKEKLIIIPDEAHSLCAKARKNKI